MIKSFSCKETKKLFDGKRCKFDSRMLDRAWMKLEWINQAGLIEDLRLPPSNRLEALSGNRKGQYSIRVNNQWRICFEWRNGDAYQVELTDYH